MALAAEVSRIHAVETPEGVSLPFTVAGVGDRLAAFLIDFVLIALASGLAGLGAFAARQVGLGTLGTAVALLATFLLRNFYFVLWEIHRGGETVGKRALGLKVIARGGGPLTAEAVVARNLMRELELFLPLSSAALVLSQGPSLAGILPILWLFAFAALPFASRDRLRAGDLAAGTLVVKRPRPVLLPDLASEPTLYRPPVRAGASPLSIAPPPLRPRAAGGAEAKEEAFTRAELDVYGIRELQVLEDLLRRYGEGSLAGQVLMDVAERIARKIGREARWTDDDAAVRFLSAFYRAQRGRLEQKLLFGQRQEKKRDAGPS
jgi:uncharacterized RDD family membrane protein YckC